MKDLLDSIVNFLAIHDLPSVLASIGELDWTRLAASGYTWLIGLPVLVMLIWTKSIKTIVALVSSFLFLLLVRNTLSPVDGALPLHDLLKFLAGAVLLVGVNLYFIFIRQ